MISVVIPSRRTDRIAQVIEELFKTTDGLVVEAIVVSDSRPEMGSVAAGAGAVSLSYPDRLGAITCWNRGLAVSRGDMLVFGADDLSWKPGWLEAALFEHEKMGGYGVVGFNDLGRDGSELATHFMYDRKFCVDHLGGVMAYPHYRFFCNDNEVNERAKRAGCFVWCKDAVVEHRHYTYGKRQMDEHDERHASMISHDLGVLGMRRMAGFPNDFDPVIR